MQCCALRGTQCTRELYFSPKKLIIIKNSTPTSSEFIPQQFAHSLVGEMTHHTVYSYVYWYGPLKRQENVTIHYDIIPK